MLLDSKPGPTLSCLVAKTKFPNHNFLTTITMPFKSSQNLVGGPQEGRIEEGQAKFEKEDVEEVDGGR